MSEVAAKVPPEWVNIYGLHATDEANEQLDRGEDSNEG